jgi:hypothetical protein
MIDVCNRCSWYIATKIQQELKKSMLIATVGCVRDSGGAVRCSSRRHAFRSEHGQTAGEGRSSSRFAARQGTVATTVKWIISMPR